MKPQRTGFRLTAPRDRLPERDVTKQVIDLLHTHGWRVQRQHSGRFKTMDGRFVTIGETGCADRLALRPAPRWCTCSDAGTCLGCQIERAVLDRVGNEGLRRLQRYTGAAAAEVFFLEVKRPGEEPCEDQQRWAEFRRREGFQVTSADSRERLARWYRETIDKEQPE